MRTSFFLLSWLLLASSTFAQTPAQSVATTASTPTTAKPQKMKGLLWEISGNGAARPSYLYGTMHVSEKLAFNLSDSFFVALRSVDVVALETDCEKWQRFQEELSNSHIGQGTRRYYSPRHNNISLYDGAFLFSTPSNEVLGTMLSYKPYLSNEFLYRSEEYRADYEENTYLDLFIHQAGKKLGKKVIGLETIDGSYEAVTRAGLPPDDKDEEESYPRGYVNRDDFEGAYRDQDLSLLDSLDRVMTPGKHYRRWMLDERNMVMANGIDSIMRRGERIFAAVGAAHLPGDEMGVIQLLRKKGYHMRPVTFNVVADPKEKESIEKMRYPVKMQTQWAPDSSWTADAPGQFYPTVEASGFGQHLYADMSNGAYYAVYQVKTNGFWTGQSQEYIVKRLDSLLYERVPGKIQERKRLEGPFPGHEITTRTRRGDILRYKIMVTPFDVLVFLIGGTGEYALGEEASRFLQTAQVRQVAQTTIAQPTVVKPRHNDFQITFPTTLLLNTTDQYTQEYLPEDYMAATTDPSDQSVYFLLRRQYHDWDYIEEDTFELNIIGEKIAEEYTKTPPQVRKLNVSAFPSQEFSFRSDKDSAYIHLRLVIDGPRYYLLGKRGRSEAPPTDFFNSFSILPNHYPEGWKERKDTTMKYTVTVPNLPEKSIPAFVARIEKLYQEASERRGGYYRGSDTRFKNIVLTSPATGERVIVTMQDMPLAEAYPTLDSVKIKTEENLTSHHALQVREKRWYDRDGLLIADYLLQDTNSNRGIRYKVLFINRKTYTLAATVNLDKPQSTYLNRVFDSFQPTDTLSKEAPWGKRSLTFLQDIYSTDSLQRKKALKELDHTWQGNFKPEDFDLLKGAIEHSGFSKLKMEGRRQLLDLLASLKSPRVVPYLVSFAARYPDSLRYRGAVLENLSLQQTEESYRQLLQLLLDQPMQRNMYGNSLFNKLNDSLQLAATLFPDILRLADIPDFQDPLYDLLYEINRDGFIKPRSYASQKKRLLLSTQYLLNRFRQGYEDDLEDGDDDESYSYASNNYSSDLKRNLALLAPFAKKDKEVQALMEHTLHLGNDQLKLYVYGLYLKQGMPVPASRLQPFAQNKETMAATYSTLAGVDKLAAYPASWFADTTLLLQSAFFGKGNRSMDSVRFISRYSTRLRSAPAWLYFFDVKRKKDKEWGFAYAYVPKDLAFLKTMEADNILNNNYNYNPRDRDRRLRQPDLQVRQQVNGKKKEEIIKKKIGAIRFENRRRYSDYDSDPNIYMPPMYEE